MTFELLEVNKEIVRALKEHGIIKPTKIQKLAIPLIKSGKDVIGMSNTGSGKTAAFGIPILEKIKPKAGLQVLILAPTRELAIQIKNELDKFARYIHCNTAAVYGGVSLDPQIHNMRKSEIVVGTTGRLVDHLRRGNLDLSRLKCIVLDEADKMVDMGFIDDIELILKKIPGDRQVLLFGATISHEIDNLKRRHMKQPQVAEAEANVKTDFLEQYYYDVMPGNKFSLLVHLLKKEETQRVLIFCSTRANVEVLAKNLKNQGLKVAMIHGKLSQNQRLRVIEGFNQDKPRILVASAVAARGLDIRDISHVFNYDLSQDPQEYIHRVGRTARAGECGKAITLLSSRDHDAFRSIKSNHDVKIERLPDEEFEKLKFEAGSQGRSSGRGGFSRGGPRRGGGGFKGRRPHGRGSSGRTFNKRSSSGSSNRSSDRGSNSDSRSDSRGSGNRSSVRSFRKRKPNSSRGNFSGRRR